MNKQHSQKNDRSLEQYEDDILKVKKIWNDLKNTNNTRNVQQKNKSLNKQNKLKNSSQEKNIQSKKNIKNKKQTIYSSKQDFKKEKDNNQQLKSTRKTPKKKKNQENKSIENTDIIQFSTLGQGKSSTNNLKYAQSQLIQNNFFSQKNNKIQQNLFNEYSNNCDLKAGKSLHSEIYNLKKQIQIKDQELAIFKVTNRRLQDRMTMLNKEIQQKDKIIYQMKSRQNQLLGQTCKLNSQKLNFEYGKVQYQNFRSDSKRLLKMLQNTQEYQTFANLALQDDGIRFLHNVNKDKKSKIDLASGTNQRAKLHYCTCNKQFLPQSGFWVPQKIFNLAKNFVKQKQGHLTEAQVQLLLYELNKYWRQREKKIINSTNALKAHQVAKYKRKIQNVNAQNINQMKLINQQ